MAAVSVLSMARHIADELRDGLSGAGVRSAARGIRRLLSVDFVGLSDLSGQVVWAPAEPPFYADANALVEKVLHNENREGRSPLVAVPLHVRHELAGVMVVAGATRRAAVREAAAWIVEALERGRLRSEERRVGKECRSR